MIQWVPIPKTGDLPEFQIGKYPVTNAQYREFVTATGHAPSRYDANAAFNADNQPVVGVTWHDATDYCAWLSKETGLDVRLPLAAQWSAAAGPHGYPWGDEFDPAKCNIAESGIGCTTPVDAYPEGQSPHGVYDLAGNVWEWCADESNGRFRRLRGGSWYDAADLARSASRAGAAPDYADGLAGFRCAVVPHAPEPLSAVPGVLAVDSAAASKKSAVADFLADTATRFAALSELDRARALRICREVLG